LFLAPKENCDEVLSNNYKNMPVVAVTDLNGAIEAINTFTKQSNAQGLPTCEISK
jgi:PDZ domain-containing secreted protein